MQGDRPLGVRNLALDDVAEAVQQRERVVAVRLVPLAQQRLGVGDAAGERRGLTVEPLDGREDDPGVRVALRDGGGVVVEHEGAAVVTVGRLAAQLVERLLTGGTSASSSRTCSTAHASASPTKAVRWLRTCSSNGVAGIGGAVQTLVACRRWRHTYVRLPLSGDRRVHNAAPHTRHRAMPRRMKLSSAGARPPLRCWTAAGSMRVSSRLTSCHRSGSMIAG